MKKFAKIFEKEDRQVLIKIEQDDECCPEVRVYFNAEDLGLGVSSTSFQFKDSDDGWNKAEKCFTAIGEKEAFRVVDNILNEFTDQLTNKNV